MCDGTWWIALYVYGYLYRFDCICDTISPPPFPLPRVSFQFQVTFQVLSKNPRQFLDSVLIPASGIKLIFAGCVVRTLHRPIQTCRRTVVTFSITKRLSEEDPPNIQRRIREIIYSISSRYCDSYVPANSKLTCIFHEITVLVTFSFVWAFRDRRCSFLSIPKRPNGVSRSLFKYRDF